MRRFYLATCAVILIAAPPAFAQAPAQSPSQQSGGQQGNSSVGGQQGGSSVGGDRQSNSGSEQSSRMERRDESGSRQATGESRENRRMGQDERRMGQDETRRRDESMSEGRGSRRGEANNEGYRDQERFDRSNRGERDFDQNRNGRDYRRYEGRSEERDYGRRYQQRDYDQGRSTRYEGRNDARASIDISRRQRSRVRDVLVRRQVEPAHLDFRVRVGARIPSYVTAYDLPQEVLSWAPGYEGYRYFETEDEIVIVDPDTMEVVAVLDQ